MILKIIKKTIVRTRDLNYSMFEIALGVTRAVDPGLAPNQLIGI